MTDYSIPDELRDRFVELLQEAWYGLDQTTEARAQAALAIVDDMAAAGFRIELRLPEFAVHDDTCCGDEGSAAVCVHDDEWEFLPCPGVGYYHWTVSE